MGKAENNERIDADILECKVDILRARDIIPGGGPPHGPKTHQEINSQINSEKIALTSDIAEASLKDSKLGKTDIPRFNLAEDIMAAQRKVISIRRKAPDKKAEVQVQQLKAGSISYNIERSTQGLSEQELIIAEIVARDIKRLHRDCTLGVR